jgi:hypothetical protein
MLPGNRFTHQVSLDRVLVIVSIKGCPRTKVHLAAPVSRFFPANGEQITVASKSGTPLCKLRVPILGFPTRLLRETHPKWHASRQLLCRET